MSEEKTPEDRTKWLAEIRAEVAAQGEANHLRWPHPSVRFLLEELDDAKADTWDAREALSDLLAVFKRVAPDYKLDTLGLEIARVLDPSIKDAG